MFACEAVDLGFLNTAPVRLTATVRVGRPPSEVFAAFAHDPANRCEFFPGFDTTGRYHTSAPHGVGSRCTKRVVGINVDETVLAWDEGARFAFRVDSTAAPAFYAWAEDYHFQPHGGDGTLLSVAMGCKPRLAFKTGQTRTAPSAAFSAEPCGTQSGTGALALTGLRVRSHFAESYGCDGRLMIFGIGSGVVGIHLPPCN